MPDTSLNSFISSNQYSKENLTFPFLAGMVLGTGYVAPSFTGVNGAASNDPGGLFGWLIYSRSQKYATPKGLTTDTYIYYADPFELVLDLNQLSGVTSCLVSATGQGGTHGFFLSSTNTLTAQTAGMQFLHAINYLAYGGGLVIAPNTIGLDNYATQQNKTYDVVLDPMTSASANGLPAWLINQPYTIGIFPTIAGSDGLTGSGNTLANYATLLGNSSLVTGLTVANRIFNVCGIKEKEFDTTSVQTGTKINYAITAIHDVAGFFARAKSRNETFLTVAGLDRSIPINGNIVNAIDWTNSLRNTLRTNRANFFVNTTSAASDKFLGSDLVGATANATVTVNDRIGPARLRTTLTKELNDVALRYIFDINNANTRNQVVSAIQNTLDPYSPYLDTTQTQIICSNANNTDNSSSLAIEVIVKPLLSTEAFSINLVYTQ